MPSGQVGIETMSHGRESLADLSRRREASGRQVKVLVVRWLVWLMGRELLERLRVHHPPGCRRALLCLRSTMAHRALDLLYAPLRFRKYNSTKPVLEGARVRDRHEVRLQRPKEGRCLRFQTMWRMMTVLMKT